MHTKVGTILNLAIRRKEKKVDLNWSWCGKWNFYLKTWNYVGVCIGKRKTVRVDFSRSVNSERVSIKIRRVSPNFFSLFLVGRSLPRTTNTQLRHKSEKSENLGRCGRQNMLWPYLKIWDWDLIFGRTVKAFSSLGIRSPRN